MATKNVDEVIVRVPQGVKTIKIELGTDSQAESNKGKSSKKKICD